MHKRRIRKTHTNHRKRCRDPYSILATILQICEQRTMRTHVIYKANLSYSMLQEYIGLALHKDLLDEAADRSLTTTTKGRLFLVEYEAIERMLANNDVSTKGGPGGTLQEESRENISQ
ncbi:MAG: winged helix-turn-helix domain-containing protein [Nitrososphaera sp.]|uniref:winged helix-turn-helix domain-containing protein n=1 Tax=Nitrososphaera sp. TaxID=1971748 RepID=UPI003D6E8C11